MNIDNVMNKLMIEVLYVFTTYLLLLSVLVTTQKMFKTITIWHLHLERKNETQFKIVFNNCQLFI